MAKHLRLFGSLEDYNNAELFYPSVAYIEETPSEVGKEVLYEKYEPPTIIARGTVTIPEFPEDITKEQIESFVAGQGFFIPIHLEYSDAAGNVMDEVLIPEISRQFTSFKVNGEETLKREPIVEIGSVNPIAVEISEAAQGPLFTEESLIMGASKLNVKFSKTPYILGLNLYLEALGGSMNIGVPLEVWVTEEPFNAFLEIISDTEFNLDVKALVDLLAVELPGLDYTTVKSTLWGADEGSTIEDINSFSPTVSGYSGGYLTTGNTKMWWNSGEYEIIMKFDRNSKPCLDYLFYGSDLCLWKEIEFRGTFNNDIELPYYTWVGPKTNGTYFTTDSGSLPKECLEKVILPKSLKTIKSRTFSGFTNLSVIDFPESVEEIGSSAFSYCTSLTDINIPESITSIGAFTFSNCTSLTSINIPESVTSIGEGAFRGCTSLTSINISNIEAWCKIEFNSSYSNPLSYAHNLYLNGELVTNLVIPESVTSIRNYAFNGCSSLTSITIPESVTSIGWGAFYGCSGELIVNCNIPSGSSYDNGAFYGGNFTKVTIGEGVTSIGRNAFYGCSSLTSITIPESVTSIGEWAFSDCTSLTSITIPEGVTSIGRNAFDNCSSLTSINIPESVTSIGDYVFDDCTSLTSINIPESVTSIEGYAFSNCTSLTSINIPENSKLMRIGRYAFEDCSSLSFINIPESVTRIGDWAFYGCSNLTSINIPESVTSIGEDAFRGCSGLTSITIPESVTKIEYGVFLGCTSLTSINIPESVTSIGKDAFRGCSSLTTIAVAEGNTTYDSRDNCNAIIETSTNTLIQGCSSTIIPNSVTSIGYGAFSGCSSLITITIPDGVTRIGNYAFSGCRNLTSISIPDGVTGFGDYAFAYCSNLTSITIPESVTSIGEVAFWECTGLTAITSKAVTPPKTYSFIFDDVDKSIPVYVPASSIDAYKAASHWKEFTNFQAIS